MRVFIHGVTILRAPGEKGRICTVDQLIDRAVYFYLPFKMNGKFPILLPYCSGHHTTAVFYGKPQRFNGSEDSEAPIIVVQLLDITLHFFWTSATPCIRSVPYR